mmetsp:Transcript_17375/g.25849  ORF Transcript_17375/g.25849 Transcript_17375/m.25849 type:complete len:219 (+) Transcript_17375:11-667(+)
MVKRKTKNRTHRVRLKPSLDDPFGEMQWPPALEKDNQERLIQVLETDVAPFEQRRSTKRTKQMVFGINETTKLLEKKSALLVILSKYQIPEMMIQHILLLCSKQKVPICIFDQKQSALALKQMFSLHCFSACAFKGATNTHQETITFIQSLLSQQSNVASSSSSSSVSNPPAWFPMTSLPAAMPRYASLNINPDNRKRSLEQITTTTNSRNRGKKQKR